MCKWITQDWCQEINSNLTQGVGFLKKDLILLNSSDTFQEENVIFNEALSKIAKKMQNTC